MKTELDLSKFRNNVHSQFGEDSIVEKLFELLKINSGFLVEIGCWDGIHLSNTLYHRKQNTNFKTCLIEVDTDRFNQLTQNFAWNDNNIMLNIEVKAIGKDSLNAIFSQYIKSEPISLLSIDIDGQDIELFESLDTDIFRPAIVIIEHGKWKAIQSLNKLVKTFADKGYNLVHVTGNFIFVDDQYNIKAKETVHKLIRKSGNPEYMFHFGKISQEQYDQYVGMGNEVDIFTRLAEPQIIEIETEE